MNLCICVGEGVCKYPTAQFNKDQLCDDIQLSKDRRTRIKGVIITMSDTIRDVMNNSLTYNIYKSLFFIHKDKLRQFNTSYICLDSNITYCFNQTVRCSSVSGRQAAPLTADLHLTCVVVSPSSQSQRSFPETADEPSSAVQSGA